MRVSVVVPCRDAEPTLALTLRSVIDQTLSPFEVLVVDDGSVDGSPDVAADFGSPVRLLRGAWGGAAATRGHGASLARGEALMFLDADDVLGPAVLETLTAALARRPDGVACCSWRRLELVDGHWLSRPASCAPRARGQDPLSAWLAGWYHPPCSVLWSRAAFEQSGGWDPRTSVNDDGSVMMRALARGVELVDAAGDRSYYRRPMPGAVTLSGLRDTRPGAESRCLVLDDLAALLERDGRLARYGPALGHAYDVVAHRCRGRHEDLRQRCRRAAARLAGPAPLRMWRRLRVRLDQPARERPGQRSDVVSWHGSSPGVGGAPPRDGPRVTVVIPAYDRAAVLPRALDSVLRQSFTDFEVLVVDDASTDETASVAASTGDPRVRCLRQSCNRGPAAARNRAVSEARGELIAFLDSDDEWLPEKLGAQVEVFERRGAACGLVYTGVEIVEGEGASRVVEPDHRGDVYEALLSENVIYGGGSNAMVRRSVFHLAGVFDETLPAIEDYDLWLRIAQFYLVDFVARPLVRYHDSVRSPGAKRVSRNFAANLDARARLFARYELEMRRVGVAHSFLLESARHQLRSEHGDAAAGRRLVLAALRRRPTSLGLYPWLPYMMMPAGVRRRLRDLEAAVRHLLGQETAEARTATRGSPGTHEAAR